jgi:hypothetical protein
VSSAGASRRSSRRLAKHPVARGVERSNHDDAVLGRESRAQVQRAVVCPVVVDVFECVRLACLLGRQTPEGVERTLELRRGQRARELEQSLLGRRRGDARQRPDLRERELAAAEGFPDRRELAQRLGHTHDLPRLAARDPAAERDVACGLVHQAAFLGERVHELDEARGGNIDVRRERRELVIQASRPRCLH